ncbi:MULTISPECIES: hypothetical protein [Kocuria]|uniref:Uncharacterized protein n=1 Tax=Kocuria rosea subsp. polaris TaxID=136273 RepID=A0A0W8I9W9_KOCRO|nr:hypothetical protein [Kocuria polaris]KUG56589.1 hypothetical protein AVL61_05885 [Kocuria polaris]
MSDPRTPVPAVRTGAPPGSSPGVPAGRDPSPGEPAGVPAISASAMSVEDYARAVQARTEFVDFLLAPARGELAAA